MKRTPPRSTLLPYTTLFRSLLMLRAEPRHDVRARGGHVADPVALDPFAPAVEQPAWEAVRVGRERLLEPEPHHLPVPGRAVLARALLGETTARADRRERGPHARHGQQGPEPQRLHDPERQSPDRSEEHTSELKSHRDLHSFPTRRSSDLAGRARRSARAWAARPAWAAGSRAPASP